MYALDIVVDCFYSFGDLVRKHFGEAYAFVLECLETL